MFSREWDAGSYHRLANQQHEWGRKVLARLSLRGDETVIDAGCGTCRVTTELAPLIPRGRILAVDLSENMLRKAREFLTTGHAADTAEKPNECHPERGAEKPNECHPERGGGSERSPAFGDRTPPPSRRTPAFPGAMRAPIYLLCADLVALPFCGVADGVFSTAAFHWVRDHDRLFQSLFAALKPGGWLEAQCGGGPNLLRLRQRAEALMARPPYAPFFAGWQPPQFYADARATEQRLRAAGFTGIAVWVRPAGFAIGNVDDYRQYLATVTLHQHLAQITDPALRERFLDELTDQALADPELHLDYWRLNLHARKQL